MDTLDTSNWYSIVDSLDKLNISRGTLYEKIKREEFTTKKEGKNRFVWIDDSVMKKNQESYIKYKDDNKEAHSQVRYLRARVEKLELELFEERKRHDTIILTLTEQNQLLLHQNTQKKPFWQFW